MNPIRVMLVDDQHLLRAGFAMLIGSQPDMEVVAEAGNGARAVELVRERPVDVILMDVRMPIKDGIAATQEILAMADGGEVPATRIVVLTTFDTDEYAFVALKAGAAGFLLKDVPPEALLASIRQVHEGGSVIAPTTTRRLLEHVGPMLDASESPEHPRDRARRAGLTDRETEILLEIAAGRSNQEVAGRMFLSEATVKTHVRRILAKLGTRDRVQAVIWAYEHGVVGPAAARDD
ncbi:response regulator transcription factor [Dietzia sp. PP-33]|jgi:DNA-binding NarL/FixJ family response regulator|uniref:response regulator transcription factor n=1 Tax=Dietzia sp. PP-33 TaxID=2957500 RepID=UPI0029A90DDD|nr:response regulator transcription factor [Dietzia sp. PP-33]MDX2356731.1 response regulator transcription factor [Dietzia sp. PP-33]